MHNKNNSKMIPQFKYIQIKKNMDLMMKDMVIKELQRQMNENAQKKRNCY